MTDGDNKGYKGPGKFTAGWGRAAAEGFVGGLVGGIIDYLTSKGSAPTRTWSMILGFAAFIHGAYKGANNAQKGIDQFHELDKKVSVLETQVNQKDFSQSLANERVQASSRGSSTSR